MQAAVGQHLGAPELGRLRLAVLSKYRRDVEEQPGIEGFSSSGDVLLCDALVESVYPHIKVVTQGQTDGLGQRHWERLAASSLCRDRAASRQLRPSGCGDADQKYGDQFAVHSVVSWGSAGHVC